MKTRADIYVYKFPRFSTQKAKISIGFGLILLSLFAANVSYGENAKEYCDFLFLRTIELRMCRLLFVVWNRER